MRNGACSLSASGTKGKPIRGGGGHFKSIYAGLSRGFRSLRREKHVSHGILLITAFAEMACQGLLFFTQKGGCEIDQERKNRMGLLHRQINGEKTI